MLALLCACSNGAELRGGDYADAGTTALALSLGHAELNPLVASGSVAGPISLLAIKYLTKAAMIELIDDAELTNHFIGSSGWGAACANATTLIGVATPLSIGVGVGCFLLVY